MIGLPDRLASTVAPASAASALGGTGTHMSSQISTCSTKPGRSVGGEQQVRAERDLLAADPDLAAHVVPGRDLAALVELPVGRQVRLGGDAQDPPAVDHDHGAVVDPVPVAQRGPHDQHRQQVRAEPATTSTSARSTASSSVSCISTSSIE